jgi:hypothetical protein
MSAKREAAPFASRLNPTPSNNKKIVQLALSAKKIQFKNSKIPEAFHSIYYLLKTQK